MSFAFSPALYRFTVIAAILWGLALILGNDLIALWPGERALLDESSVFWGQSPLGKLLVGFVGRTLDYDLFGLRLIGALSYVLSLVAMFHWGNRLFGRSTTLVALLVGMSLFLPNVWAKSFDPVIISLPAQVAFGLSLLYFLKTNKQVYAVVLFGALGVFSTGPSMLLYGSALYALLAFLHPKGRTLTRLLVPLWLLGFYLIKWAVFGLTIVDFSFSENLTGLGWQGLSLLPWLGFALAGLWHLLRRSRRGDEFVIIFGSWFLAALISGGLVLQLIVAFVIAKQATDFYRPGYPYKPIIIFGSVLQLVGFFFLATYAMMTGFQELGGTGFRIGMALGLVYWIPGVFGLVGLWSKGPGLLIGGRVLSGILVLLVGWLLVYPVLAQELHWEAPRIEATGQPAAD